MSEVATGFAPEAIRKAAEERLTFRLETRKPTSFAVSPRRPKKVMMADSSSASAWIDPDPLVRAITFLLRDSNLLSRGPYMRSHSSPDTF
jgi:hypothetical protein